MPLRDHFRPPVSKQASWQGFHGLWPGVIVLQLFPKLPEGFQIEPRSQLGSFYEVDVSAYDREPDYEPSSAASFDNGGSPATATLAPPVPSLTVETELAEEYAYEVLVFDVREDRRLVAAIEIVSPANKDRPSSRQIFIAKCANLMRQDVCVSIVDLVTIRHFNLYVELLALLKRRDPTLPPEPPDIYAATCRKREIAGKSTLETWSYPLVLGQPLPRAFPIWLTDRLHITLDLEASYEETCRPLGIR